MYPIQGRLAAYNPTFRSRHARPTRLLWDHAQDDGDDHDHDHDDHDHDHDDQDDYDHNNDGQEDHDHYNDIWNDHSHDNYDQDDHDHDDWDDHDHHRNDHDHSVIVSKMAVIQNQIFFFLHFDLESERQHHLVSDDSSSFCWEEIFQKGLQI